MAQPQATEAARRRQRQSTHASAEHERSRSATAVRPPAAAVRSPARARPQARPSGRAKAALEALERELDQRSSGAPGRPARAHRGSATTAAQAAGATQAAERRGQLRLQAPRLDRIVRGRAWIPLVAAMLVLIVGLRVEVLKLSAGVGNDLQQVASLQSSDAILAARISALSDNGRIERLAASYGMHLPNPLDVHFLEGGTGADVSAAIRNISRPSAAAFLAGLAAEQQHDALLTQAGSTLSAIGAPPTTPTTSLSTSAVTTAATGG
jgi:hypothetical protein